MNVLAIEKKKIQKKEAIYKAQLVMAKKLVCSTDK
mgnify:CR=1 FL=1|jgi:hypothetical protein|tara:strand:+ start:4640 stop:4744 length:105 start_codon:yes stop_codon:yes gene_type:complete